MNKLQAEIEKILLKQGKFYISLELDRIEKILELLGNPQDTVRGIHVGGTNGKGSTCAIINQILIEQGYTVGLYTSPHLVKYNERIKLNNKPISDREFLNLIKEITNLAENNEIHLTEFEILTAVMYKYFSQNKVDFAIVEVGLGGRFDATNVINSPEVSVITSISLDHTERLGDTIEKIAFEKSGIIKQNCDVIFNENNLGAKVLTQTARTLNAKSLYPKKAKITYFDGKNILRYGEKEYELNLLGKHQAENAALALCAVDKLIKKGVQIDEASIKSGLKKVLWRARFDYIKEKNLLIDGCHNPDGARVLKESLDYYFPKEKRTFVYTSLKNKDYIQIQKNLFRAEDKIYLLNTNSDKFTNEGDMIKMAQTININEVEQLINTSRKNELLIICGSLYAIGDILGKIKICNF